MKLKVVKHVGTHPPVPGYWWATHNAEARATTLLARYNNPSPLENGTRQTVDSAFTMWRKNGWEPLRHLPHTVHWGLVEDTGPEENEFGRISP